MTIADPTNRATFVQRRLVGPLLAQLKKGVGPEELAWSAGLGVALSVLPIPGVTSALCTVVALALRLNLVTIQLANFAAAPLQLLLLIPFIQLGQRLLGEPALPLTLAQLQLELGSGALHFLSFYGEALARGVLAWFIAAPLVAVALRLLLRPVFARVLGTLSSGSRIDAP